MIVGSTGLAPSDGLPASAPSDDPLEWYAVIPHPGRRDVTTGCAVAGR
jgi:hypothetical protein